MNALVKTIPLVLLATASAASAQTKSPADVVDARIGTISRMLVPTVPSIQRPNGMLRTVPPNESFTTDRRTGPVSVEGVGEYPQSRTALWHVLKTFRIRHEHATGVALEYQTGRDGCLRVDGEKGWIRAQYTGNARLQAHDEPVLRLRFRDTDTPVIRRGDKEDFIYAIRNNCNTMIDAETGHRTASLAHIGQIAIQRGRTLSWNPRAGRFAEDAQANQMLHRPYRKPWVLS